MTTHQRPAVFVSSTCYDLAQLRQDLRDAILNLGMEPILSEINSFPVDPNLGTVENCLAAVKSNADIFVLIVGARYGSQPAGGRSITNLEYLEARAMGIPRYVFVLQSVLSNLPVWKTNPTADFSGVVDSTKLFEFVDTLRDPSENWIFGFSSARDIIGTLQQQFAYLIKDALDLRGRVMRAGVSQTVQDLPGPALFLAINRPYGWEYRLLAEVLTYEIAQASGARRDLKYGVALGPGVALSDPAAILAWLRTKLGEISQFSEAGSQLVNVALRDAVGLPGESGNVEDIVYVGRRIGDLYRRLIEWALEFSRVSVAGEFRRPLNKIAEGTLSYIDEGRLSHRR